MDRLLFFLLFSSSLAAREAPPPRPASAPTLARLVPVDPEPVSYLLGSQTEEDWPGLGDAFDLADTQGDGIPLLLASLNYTTAGDSMILFSPLGLPLGDPVAQIYAADEYIGEHESAVDYNGDGYGDLIIALTRSSTLVGLSGPFLGIHDISSVDWTLSGEPEHEDFGMGLAVADLNGDGVDELWTAAEAHVYQILLNKDPLPPCEAEAELWGPGNAGETLVPLGDSDGDGWEELAVSSNTWPGWSSTPGGAVFLVEGELDRYTRLIEFPKYTGTSS